jgi:hypothetical protein
VKPALNGIIERLQKQIKERHRAIREKEVCYGRKQEERDAICEKVKGAPYGMIEKLQKQIEERDRAIGEQEECYERKQQERDTKSEMWKVLFVA